jgi:hypothetical protein
MLFSASESTQAAALAQLSHTSPFLGERKNLERMVLGPSFIEGPSLWSRRAELNVELDNPNTAQLQELAERLAAHAREQLLRGERASAAERQLYEDIALYVLYYRYHLRLHDLIQKRIGEKSARERVAWYPEFVRDSAYFLDLPGHDFASRNEWPHMLACFFQLQRAFQFIFQYLTGGSLPAAQLRAETWQSIFTSDLRRYRRSLCHRMGDVPTLITGPTGSGKELVARAISLSRYIPFDPGRLAFTEDFQESFQAVNVAALSPTLIESELFGHRRGAFTGAFEDRAGWLETCGPLGCIFLDEIGDQDSAIQVKLLRVLQTRSFSRLGETTLRTFRGKLIAATNRDLGGAMRAGRFRPDLYYRLCADHVETPPLSAQLRGDSHELGSLLRFIAERVAGEVEAEGVAGEAEKWIRKNLAADYPWPGNFRELEQCVRSVMVRGEYRPLTAPPSDASEELARDITASALTAEELLCRYCALVYERTQNYEETGRCLGLDRRTVKSKVEASRRQI